jgi:hypothetical protein
MNTDKAASIFWLFISIIVSVASFRLGLGKFSSLAAAPRSNSLKTFLPHVEGL